MTLRAALDRTLLLMRDEVNADVGDAALVTALTGTRVALVADTANIGSHAAQTAFVTAATLMARSGHAVHLFAPDVPLVGAQPPLTPGGGIVTRLVELGADLWPGVGFHADEAMGDFDLAILLGCAALPVRARRVVRMNADAWTGRLSASADVAPFGASWWPFGGMAAAALAAAEAFKVSLRKLDGDQRNPARLASVFGDVGPVAIGIAPPATPYVTDVGRFDCVSGGAIIQSALYVLARVPGVRGTARVIEPDRSDLSNLNRYMLLRRSRLDTPKADDLADICGVTGISVRPVNRRFETDTVGALAALADNVLVGVDDIPSRWLVQRQRPHWLCVGATTHWSAMASFHERGTGCAECLHPYDDRGNGPIPTVAFVSFWAGLLTAAYLARRLAGVPARAVEQQVYLTAPQAGAVLWSSVPARTGCPTCAQAQDRANLAS